MALNRSQEMTKRHKLQQIISKSNSKQSITLKEAEAGLKLYKELVYTKAKKQINKRSYKNLINSSNSCHME